MAKPWEHAKGGEGSGADELATRFVESLSYDRRMYRHDIAGSMAHAKMLAKVGLIGGDDLVAIERGLGEIEKEIDAQGDAWPGWKIELEDVHMCIEAALIEKAGDAGRKLHTGRSRNDQVALDLRLWTHEACERLEARHRDLMLAFMALAERDGRIVMPSYTHLQRAQPIVVGGELMAWCEAIGQCAERYAALRSRLSNPLGSGAIAGSSLPLDREATTAAFDAVFGVGGVGGSAIEATASRDVAIDLTYAMTMTAMWLSRWAEQWIIYATTEFGFITLDDRYTTGSSMMPQKQNPDMLELIRGRCGNIYGHLVALLTMCKGITIGYNRDLQEDKRQVFAAFDMVCDCLDMAARITRTSRFNEPRIAEGLERGFLDATSLAEYLVTKGVAFRSAHQVVGRLVRACTERGLVQLSQLSVDDFNNACDALAKTRPVDDDVYDWLGPANVVNRYQTAFNAGQSGFEQQLARWRERLEG